MAEVNFLVKKGLTVPKGSAATPAVIFDASDPNTGIYSPGADQLALSTNGTGRLFVDASGNVVIGATTATDKLDLVGGGFRIQRGADSDNILRIDGADGTTEFLTLGVTGGDAVITGAGVGSTNTGLVFRTASSGTETERLRITSAGLVGIGTSSPGGKLEIATGVNDYTNVANTFSVRGPNSTGLYVGTHYDGSGGGCDIASRGYATSLGDFRFISLNGSYASPVTRMVIDPSGRVGIGVTSPAFRIDVKGANASTARFDNDGSQYTQVRWANNGTGKADINWDNTSGLFTIGTVVNNPVTFLVNGSEKARLDTSGRLLVGTSSALNVDGNAGFQPFQIAGIGASLSRFSADSAGPSLSLTKSRSATTGSNTIVQSGDFIGTIGFRAADGSTYVNAAQISAVVDGTPGANDMPGRLVFSVTADGASSPTEALRISNNRAITVSDGGNVVLGTTTGTKIGTATTQKLGFYNATPVVQPAAVADATDAATVITQLNDLLAKLRTLGIIAT